MYAVIETGGKQYKVRKGDTVDVELIGAEMDTTVVLDRVLVVASDSGVEVGTPHIEGATVQATVIDQVKGDKVVVFKYKPKNRYRRKTGHRQKYTRLLIDRIVVPGMEVQEEEAMMAEEEAPDLEAWAAEPSEPVEAGVAEAETVESQGVAEDISVTETAADEIAEAPSVEVEEAEGEEPVE